MNKGMEIMVCFVFVLCLFCVWLFGCLVVWLFGCLVMVVIVLGGCWLLSVCSAL